MWFPLKFDVSEELVNQRRLNNPETHIKLWIFPRKRQKSWNFSSINWLKSTRSAIPSTTQSCLNEIRVSDWTCDVWRMFTHLIFEGEEPSQKLTNLKLVHLVCLHLLLFHFYMRWAYSLISFNQKKISSQALNSTVFKPKLRLVQPTCTCLLLTFPPSQQRRVILDLIFIASLNLIENFFLQIVAEWMSEVRGMRIDWVVDKSF